MNSRINLAHITLSMGIGGIEKLIVSLIGLLGREKYSITVICLDFGGELVSQLKKQGVEVLVIGRKDGLDWRLFFKLAHLFRERKFDIVHTHNQAALFYAGIAAKLARIPLLITTEHSRHNTEGKWRRQLEKRLLCRISNKWIVVSKELAEESVVQDGLPIGKIKVIENGVDFKKYDLNQQSKPLQQDKAKNELGLSEDCKIIIMVARLHPIKNHKLFLESFSEVLGQCPNTHVLIVGDGECRDALVGQAAALQISAYVHFLGYREDVAELLELSDVFVLCSKSEGLPVSLLEACAAHVSVLITKSSNKAGLIVDGSTGTVVEDNKASLRDGLLTILNNFDKAKALSNEAALQVKAQYSLSAMCKKYQNIYSCCEKNK